jgi:hypothetical protein
MQPRILNLLIPLLLFCLPPLSVQARASEVMEHLQAIAASPDRSLGTAGELHGRLRPLGICRPPAQLKAVIGRQAFTTVGLCLGKSWHERP